VTSQRVFRIDDLFDLVPGEFHAKKELEVGSIPLISCGEESNGLIGYYDIPAANTHERALTVAFNGFPLTTKFHPYRFGAKDDVAVLVPRNEMGDGLLIYIAAQLNAMRWRYSYGRKCYREKLKKVEVRLPMLDDGVTPDSAFVDTLLEQAFTSVKQMTERSVGALLRPKDGGKQSRRGRAEQLSLD
jgi:type I restriction enzyme M protein